jgi:hypothetical protein
MVEMTRKLDENANWDETNNWRLSKWHDNRMYKQIELKEWLDVMEMTGEMDE